MNTKAPYDHTSARIRSVDFAQFEKPKSRPHWPYDETKRTKARRPTQSETVARALRMLSAMTAE